VDEGLPDLLVKANALIRPIRCDQLRLHSLEPWDDDPNPRFDYQSSLDWVRRFDEDSQWPTHPRPRGQPPALRGGATHARGRRRLRCHHLAVGRPAGLIPAWPEAHARRGVLAHRSARTQRPAPGLQRISYSSWWKSRRAKPAADSPRHSAWPNHWYG